MSLLSFLPTIVEQIHNKLTPITTHGSSRNNTGGPGSEGKNYKDLFVISMKHSKDIYAEKVLNKKAVLYCTEDFLCGYLPDLLRCKQLLSFAGCHSYINKGKAGK